MLWFDQGMFWQDIRCTDGIADCLERYLLVWCDSDWIGKVPEVWCGLDGISFAEGHARIK
jgi:hypothetical protein